MKHFQRKWEADITHPDISQLYAKWSRIRKEEHDPMFDNFDTFYWWAKSAGYTPGAILKRNYPTDPYTPDTCYFEIPEKVKKSNTALNESIRKFDRTVAAIRRAYGLPPLKTEVG